MFIGAPGVQVKWTKVADKESMNEDVLLSMGSNKKTFGSFENRVFMQETNKKDASILITGVSVEDHGKYRCEISNGASGIIQEVFLELQGCLSDGKNYFILMLKCIIFLSFEVFIVIENLRFSFL